MNRGELAKRVGIDGVESCATDAPDVDAAIKRLYTSRHVRRASSDREALLHVDEGRRRAMVRAAVRGAGRLREESGGSSSSSTAIDTSVSTVTRNSNGGSYEIDGFTITLRYDDGKVETRIIEISDDCSIVHIEDKYR